MLSTISSLLPSALTSKLEKLDLSADGPSHPDQSQDEGVKRKDMTEENKREKKKKSTSNETFILVRPPPAKTNHPLNLQLQLVPAQHTKERSNTSAAITPTSRFSGDFTEGTESAVQPPPSPAVSESDQNHDLQRSESTRSNRSEVSTFYTSGASSGSVTSFASTASNASGRRMIIPLYNLSAHNVMTNTILDAGTDAKVAKFHKRGLEIICLAILEPAEVWYGPSDGTEHLGAPIRRSMSGNSLAPPDPSGRRSGTPEPQHSPNLSKISVSSGHSGIAAHPVETTTPIASTQPGKKLFGRIFRRKEGSSGGGHAQTASISLTPAESTTPTPILEVRAPSVSTPAWHAVEIVLPPVLGLSPTLAGEAQTPMGRCVAHVWTVRRWLKTDNQSLISGVIGKISREVSSQGHGPTLGPSEWEVRFEWARGRSKGEKTRKVMRRTSVDAGGRKPHTPSRRNSAHLGPENVTQNFGDHPGIPSESPRQSLDVAHGRKNSRTPSPRRSHATDAGKATSIASTVPSDDEGAHSGTGEDHAEDSDPEDSETPWTCTFVLTHPSHPIAELAPRARPKGHSRTRTLSAGIVVTPSAPRPADKGSPFSDNGHGSDAAPLRIKVATLSPAPHHPKVICQLKVPFPLPDVEVDHGVLRKRLVLPDGSTRSTIPREHSGLVMTAEEIKDVVCSTAFWLVVRQGFGGLGKKTRKGDGWKIRG